MTFFRLDNKWLIWPLFLFLMTYVILRAFLVEPLFDELATLYWYIQTGYLPGRGATMDANNHILNSLISALPDDRFLHVRFYNDDRNLVNLSGIHIKILAVTKK